MYGELKTLYDGNDDNKRNSKLEGNLLDIYTL
mgnify:CR=1 FL=1